VSRRLLVNFFYAQPVGHAVEALHYAHGYHLADPELDIAVALNAATAVELAGLCPFVSEAYAVEHPFVEPGTDSAASLRAIPREWTWVIDDVRRLQGIQLDLFAGMRDYYAASDAHFAAERRTVTGAPQPPFVRHAPLRLAVPGSPGDEPLIALMPAGSSERALYPSTRSWTLILDALAEAFPDVRVALIGRLARDRRTSTSFTRAELDELLAHPGAPLDCFDLPLVEQLAVVARSGLFLAPHTGFGLAALAVGTPWLALSGGRWFEYFFNHVPFRSILPDPERYPSFSQFAPPEIAGDRTPSMSERRIREDLDRIVTAAGELLSGSLEYERALREYFSALLEVHGGDASAIWSIDGVHLEYLG
jgi:hypothetical protein